MEEGASVNVSELTLSPHTGTHADAPLHYNSLGAPLNGVALDAYVGPALVVEVATSGAIMPEHLAGVELTKVERLLVKTPASLRPDDEWWDDFAYLAQETAELIGRAGVRLFGTDASSVDHVHSKTLDAHHTFDRYGVYILENLQLRDVPPGQYELIALPLKVAVDGSPVRAALRSLD
jgi:arylformamidase